MALSQPCRHQARNDSGVLQERSYQGFEGFGFFFFLFTFFFLILDSWLLQKTERTGAQDISSPSEEIKRDGALLDQAHTSYSGGHGAHTGADGYRNKSGDCSQKMITSQLRFKSSFCACLYACA